MSTPTPTAAWVNVRHDVSYTKPNGRETVAPEAEFQHRAVGPGPIFHHLSVVVAVERDHDEVIEYQVLTMAPIGADDTQALERAKAEALTLAARLEAMEPAVLLAYAEQADSEAAASAS
jgi:hypothetical protein